MHTKSTTELITMAQAVLVSLIESHKVIEPCEIENNLLSINSLLIDASVSSSKNAVMAMSNINPQSAMSLLDALSRVNQAEVVLDVWLKGARDEYEACLISSIITLLQGVATSIEEANKKLDARKTGN